MVAVTADDRGSLIGMVRCLPISKTTYETMLHSSSDLREVLSQENILDNDEVISNVLYGCGNYCTVGMIVYDPDRTVESYGLIAADLFRRLRNEFYRIRLRALVCRPHPGAAEKAVEDVGCTKAADLPGSAQHVWYFDESCALGRYSQLAEVYTDMWLAKVQLHLTRRQRQVLVALALGFTPKRGAAELHISEKTFRTHVAGILAEARRHKEIFPRGTEVTRELLLTYCQNNPIELKVPF
jgi:DNA-directed RNA polymerase specialized sigma24 family protein